jgi:hypothetical protein
MIDKRSVADQLIEKLRGDLSNFTGRVRNEKLTETGRKKLISEIARASESLNELLAELDPIKRPKAVFDPGNPRTIGFFIALALTAQPRHRLSSLVPHYGSGIYAIYYNGDFDLYRPLRRTETPIYIGQAAPGNESARTPVDQGIRLAARLNEHRKTIEHATTTLKIKDFEYRSLVVQTGWETGAEDYLIRLFRPIWNKESKIIQGFGKHGDSPLTRKNRVSTWDVLHQGRKAAGAGVNPAQKSKKDRSPPGYRPGHPER